MPALVLYTQEINTLEIDDEVTELVIAQEWLTRHTSEQIIRLSQIYPNVSKLNLSDLDLLRTDTHKITAFTMAFPEIEALVLAESSEQVVEIIQKISLGLTFLKATSFSAPPNIARSSSSILNPINWAYSFWSASQPAQQHHDTMRDLFDITQINEGESNILSDWNRLDAGLVEINGHPIQTLIQKNAQGELFASKEALQDFLKTELLSRLSAEQQERALEYTMKVLHQGGLQNPVSAAVYYNSASKLDLPQPVDARNKHRGIPGQERITSFNATASGFIVHEKLTQNRLAYSISSEDKAGELVLPDAGSSFVFKAEVQLKINWSPAAEKPQITLDAVGVTFGSAFAKALFDERWLYQKWIDNAGYYAGLNSVNDFK